MNIITKFDVGDKTKQGEVFSIHVEVNHHGGLVTTYWLREGSRFFQESELVAENRLEPYQRNGVTVTVGLKVAE